MCADSHTRRLWAPERRRQLLQVAGQLLAEAGVDGVRIPDVARAAGVSRPVVYKHFASRQALLIGLLERWEEELSARFEAALEGAGPELEPALEIVLDNTMDALEAQGPGAWRLLGAAGPDPEIERVAQIARDQLSSPWLRRIQAVLAVDERQARAICAMSLAVSRAVVDRWLAGELSREEAVATGVKGVGGLMRAFIQSDA